MDVTHVNNPSIIRRNKKLVAINSAIEVDLTGQVCADSIGTYQYSGIGGQMDFIRGAALSEGGKPIIALTSRTKKGVPRIVPYLKEGAGVVTTRGHIHYVVTEYGVAYLYGKNMRQRAKLLIDIAHPDEINTKLEQIDKFYILIKQLNNNAMLEALVANDKKVKIKDENNAQRKFRFEENVESIQGSLVSLLNELESNIYDEDKLKQFINIMRYSNGAPTLDKLTGSSATSSNIISQFRTTLGIIASEIIYSYETSFRNEVLDVYNYLGADISGLEVEVFDKLNEKGEVTSLLMQRMETALLKLLTNMYKDFGTSLSQAKANYAAGRAERNPIIKQTVQKPNNFKTFIISQKILLDLYEILTYIDAQKYIAGLLRFPPSKLSGDLTKMRYIISRLGLSSNPVFIIDQFSRSVILSSPDVLSLTGTPIFNRITNDQMKAICKIDYNKDLWNSKDYDEFIVHCFQGISRSGAVGEFMNELFGEEWREFKLRNMNVNSNPYILEKLQQIHSKQIIK
jgi:hypothetical protein